MKSSLLLLLTVSCLASALCGCGPAKDDLTPEQAQSFKGAPPGGRTKEAQEGIAAQREKFAKMHPELSGNQGPKAGPPPAAGPK